MNGSIMFRLKEMRSIIDHRRGKRDSILELLYDAEAKQKQYESRMEDIERARTIIQHVAKETQSALEYHVSSLVSLALSSIFPDPYEFKLLFDVRSNRTEADTVFVRNGESMSPVDASGGGPVDVASFGLRISAWCIAQNRTRPTLFFDEPFRFVSRDLQPVAGQMLRDVCERMGIQAVVVTHEEEFIDVADRVFEVKNIEGISYVKQRGYETEVKPKRRRAIP